ncbi:MAG: hypothetical protein MJ056_04370 [Akkermansia sp.]|nr:hypothetical protein [Akkermansia sp.]
MKHIATAPPACPSRRRGRQHFAMDYHCAAAASSSRLREYTQIKTRIDEQSVRTKELERNNAKKVQVVSYCILVNSSNREKKIEFNVNFFQKNSEFWPSGVLILIYVLVA